MFVSLHCSGVYKTSRTVLRWQFCPERFDLKGLLEGIVQGGALEAAEDWDSGFGPKL